MTALLLPGALTAILLLSFGMWQLAGVFVFAYAALLGMFDLFGGKK
jgi:uncharacterized membrane protein